MPSDPRVFFASERTLLAWVRTGIALVGLGFVISRFGLFLRLVGQQGVDQDALHAHPGLAGHSGVIGIALVVLGAVSIAAASIQHARFISTLPEHDRPAHYSRTWAVVLGGLVAVVSLGLAVFLVQTGP